MVRILSHFPLGGPVDRSGTGTNLGRTWLLGAALAGAALLPVAGHAEPGVSPDKIVLGQAAPLDGPAAALGQDMQKGLLAAFAEANKAGGVKGRKLELVSRDDG